MSACYTLKSSTNFQNQILYKFLCSTINSPPANFPYPLSPTPSSLWLLVTNQRPAIGSWFLKSMSPGWDGSLTLRGILKSSLFRNLLCFVCPSLYLRQRRTKSNLLNPWCPPVSMILTSPNNTGMILVRSWLISLIALFIWSMVCLDERKLCEISKMHLRLLSMASKSSSA